MSENTTAIAASTPAPLAQLYGALARAQGRASSVKIDGVNVEEKYRYATAEAILVEGRAALSAEGLALLLLTGRIVRPATGSEKASPIWWTTWRLVHASGESIELTREWPIVAGGRPSDKATATADTSCLKFLVRDLLLLPRVEPGEDLDARASEKVPPKASATAPSGAPTPAAESRDAAPSKEKVRELRGDLARQQELNDLRNNLKTLIKKLPSSVQPAAWSEFNAWKNSKEATEKLRELAGKVGRSLTELAANETTAAAPASGCTSS